MRYFPFAVFFVYLVLVIGNAGAADNADYEIIDPELLKEEDEETATREPVANESPGAAETAGSSAAGTESGITAAGPEPDQTDWDTEEVKAAYDALQNQEYDTRL